MKTYRVLVETKLSYDVPISADNLGAAEEAAKKEISETLLPRIADATPDRVVMDIEYTINGIFIE